MIHDQFNDEIQSMMVVSMLMSSSIALSFAHIHAATHTTLRHCEIPLMSHV